MTDAARLAVFGAAGIAMMSALFGVLIARWLWAEDLRFAREIDAIRKQTELSLRRQIDAQDSVIATLRRRLGEK